MRGMLTTIFRRIGSVSFYSRSYKKPQHKASMFLFLGSLVLFSAGLTSEARATGLSNTCSELDTSLGGGPVTFGNDTLFLTVVADDRIVVSIIGNGVSQYTSPTVAFTNVPANPTTFDVTPADAGSWVFQQGILGTMTISCTVGGAAGGGSNTVDGLLSSFNQVGGAIFAPDGVSSSIINGGGAGISFNTGAASGFLNRPSRVDASDPFYKEYGFGFAERDFDSIQNRASSNMLEFSIDQRSLARLGKSGSDHAKSSFSGKALNASEGSKSPLNTWITGRYVDFDDDDATADRSGHSWSLTSGLSYNISDVTTLGVFSRVRDGEVTSKALSANLDSSFYGAGVFASTSLHGGVRIAGAVLFEHGDSDVTISNVAGRFDTSQLTLETKIDKRIEVGQHWIEPAVKVLYMDIDRDGYRDSNGVEVAKSDLNFGRVTLGPSLGTVVAYPWGAFKPFVRANYLWNFANEGDFVVSNTATFSTADSGVRIGTGFEISMHNGVVIDASSNLTEFDTNLTAWSVTGGLGVPLHVLGLGGPQSAGFLKLDLAANRETQSGKAKIAIPLN